MRIDYKNEIDLAKHLFINILTWVGIVVLAITYFYNSGNSTLQTFIFSVGLTIFILGITVGYANKSIHDQILSQKFIITQLQEMEKKILSIIQPQNSQSTEKIPASPSKPFNKNCASSVLSDEDKIIFEHLFDRHKAILSYVDTFDAKLGSIVALNGVVLSFSMFSADKAKNEYIFLTGVIIILFAIIFGCCIYRTKYWYIGASVEFFTDYDTFTPGVGLQKLKKQLILDIERNQDSYQDRVKYFNIMVHIMILGIVFLGVGFYV